MKVNPSTNLFDFIMQLEGAYEMLDDLEELNLKPTVGMYNTIMAECFREVMQKHANGFS